VTGGASTGSATGGTGSASVHIFVDPRGSVEHDRSLLVARAARVLARDPSEVTVTRRCDHCGGAGHGRPVVDAPVPVFASLSRASGLVAIAVSLAAPVGVDIESLDAVAAAGFDDVALTEDERRRVAGSTDPMRLRAALWTRKEALLKATGAGLRVDPATIGFDGDTLAHWAAATPRPEAVLREFEVAPGYVGAVALLERGDGGRVDPAVDDRRDGLAACVLGERLDELP
jgi:phosphopantetheinyl transferase